MKIRIIILGLVAVVTLGACEKKFDSLLNNPNNPAIDQANADLYLNQLQISFINFWEGTSNYGMAVTRQLVWFGPTYQNGYQPESFDGVWTTAYTGVLKHANALIPVADQQKKYVAEAIAKTLKAYTIITLVDMFGDVPFAEANLGVENTNPKVSKGSDVYAQAIALYESALADLAKTSASYPGSTDLFYQASDGAGAAKWKTTINTLLLRAYLSNRLVNSSSKDKINALIASGDLINGGSKADFEFKWGTSNANPDNRNPHYGGNYSSTGSTSDYIGTWFMWSLVGEKGTFNNSESKNNSDPRTRYYFYRQRTNNADANQNSSSCLTATKPSHYSADMPFCSPLPGFSAGFWGRDHGDNSGIPPDGNLRTTWGIYPAGGDFDANQGKSVGLSRGGKGAGISPLWLGSFTEFAKAEAALTLGTTGDPRALLENGVRKSISKVIGFPATIGYTVPTAAVPSQTRIDDYVTKVLNLYDAATDTKGRLDVVMKEWYLAAWGNGFEPYNGYRRTGFPSKMQPAIQPAPGEYMRSCFYPSVYVNLNLNAAQKSNVGVRVFWDTNPVGFIN